MVAINTALGCCEFLEAGVILAAEFSPHRDLHLSRPRLLAQVRRAAPAFQHLAVVMLWHPILDATKRLAGGPAADQGVRPTLSEQVEKEGHPAHYEQDEADPHENVE
jgi:hypothetical protein